MPTENCPKVLDTPIGWAQQIIEDAEVSLKNGNRLSEPNARYLMLAKAYMERTEELRISRNMNTALTHDLAIYKQICGADKPPPGCEMAYDKARLVVSER